MRRRTRGLALPIAVLALVTPPRGGTAEETEPHAPSSERPQVSHRASGQVVVTVDAKAGTKPISPWIYGLNDAGASGRWGAHPTQKYITLTRLGGRSCAGGAVRE